MQGAPTGLSTIIEGESLLNDGVAFVIFLFTVDVLGGSSGGFDDFMEQVERGHHDTLTCCHFLFF